MFSFGNVINKNNNKDIIIIKALRITVGIHMKHFHLQKSKLELCQKKKAVHDQKN